ncbi:MAG: hypothetical protein Q8Q81_04605 [Oxalobacteraceae bacterium]|nr:hypothetical protein [Oxalobacteraceae bacterium]
MMHAEYTETEREMYDPNRLLDAVLKKMCWDNDATLARKLNVHANVIHRIRSGTLPLGASMLMWMQEATGMSIDELRQLMGDRRSRLRLSYA